MNTGAWIGVGFAIALFLLLLVVIMFGEDN
jgi:hypothetical protein